MDRRELSTFGIVALVGGVIGGGVVGLIGATTGWGGSSDDAPPGTCSVTDVADTALPSVVTVSVSGPHGAGTGSGVVYRLASGESVIVTNAHVVVLPNTPLSATTVRLQYADGRTSAAQIAGTDVVTDLAVVRPADTDTDAPPIAVGDSRTLRVGTPVVALGSPLGLTSTVTSGIVSATGRYVRVPTENGAAHLVGAIQTDAAINPGNSGGALVDCDSRLVGINTAGAAPAGETGNAGLGFAIPIAVAQPLVAELAETGRVAHPSLGLQVQQVPPSMQSTAGGAVVVSGVSAGGPAAQAGVRPGDVIVDIAGQRVQSPDDVQALELGFAVGQQVPVHVIRDGQSSALTVTVAPS